MILILAYPRISESFSTSKMNNLCCAIFILHFTRQSIDAIYYAIDFFPHPAPKEIAKCAKKSWCTCHAFNEKLNLAYKSQPMKSRWNFRRFRSFIVLVSRMIIFQVGKSIMHNKIYRASMNRAISDRESE